MATAAWAPSAGCHMRRCQTGTGAATWVRAAVHSDCCGQLLRKCLRCRNRERVQDIIAGDGTTSVTVMCGALLNRCLGLLEKGVHPTLISEAFQTACDRAVATIKDMAIPVDLKDREALTNAAMTCALMCPRLISCEVLATQLFHAQ